MRFLLKKNDRLSFHDGSREYAKNLEKKGSSLWFPILGEKGTWQKSGSAERIRIISGGYEITDSDGRVIFSFFNKSE